MLPMAFERLHFEPSFSITTSFDVEIVCDVETVFDVHKRYILEFISHFHG